jgi:hypothetical protein
MFGKPAPVVEPVVLPATVQEMYGGIALISVAWVFFAYFVMPLGPIGKFSGRSPGQCKWGDRTFMNLMEQAPLFFVSLWTCAVFVSVDTATLMGWMYMFFRALYPIIWAVKGGEGGPPVPHLFASTFPAYGINVYMAATVAFKLGAEIDLKEALFGSDLVGFALCTVGFLMFATKVTPMLHIKCYTQFFDAPKKD